MRNDNERLYLIDWLKILILAAIQTFHANEFIFFEDDLPLVKTSMIYAGACVYSRFFTLGGQGLVSIIYLLFGLSGKSKLSLLKIAVFALLGQIILTLSFFEGDYLAQIEWDIYLYLAASNLILLFPPRASWALVAFSVLMLLVPPAFWKDIGPQGMIGDLLVGRSISSPDGAWPLLPWFFLAMLFFNLGSLIREGKLRPNHWEKTETFIWPVFFGLSLPFLGSYYWSPGGPGFYAYNFHQSSHLFWTNFLPFIFVMRIAFLDSVKEKLARHRASRFIGSLMWTRQLGAAYIVSVIYIGIGARFEATYRESFYAFDLFFLSIMPVTEVIVRCLVYVKQKLFRLPGGSSAR